jgi:hypothetical protein
MKISLESAKQVFKQNCQATLTLALAKFRSPNKTPNPNNREYKVKKDHNTPIKKLICYACGLENLVLADSDVDVDVERLYQRLGHRKISAQLTESKNYTWQDTSHGQK